VVVQDLGSPPFEGAAQGLDLWDVVSEAAFDGLVQQHSGVGDIVGEIHVSN